MTAVASKFDSRKMRRLIVALCLFGVCIGTQRIQTEKWDSGLIDFFRDWIGILMAVILFTHYRWCDFVKYKLPYLIWTGSGIVLGLILTPLAIARRPAYLLADTIAIALGIFLMGYCVLHTVICFFVEKKRPRLYIPLFAIWGIMLLLMIFSRSDSLWPMAYFVLFLTYYMTEQTEEQRQDVLLGIIDGMILGFLVIQSHSLLCRPYDRLRYCGNFCNPNHNCAFLCFCLAAILGKVLVLTRNNGKKIVKLFYFFLAEACYAFIFFTVSRSGYLTACVITIVFLAMYCRVKGKNIFIRTGLLLIALFVAVMPATYLAVRYIPTIHPHVVFYFQEGYSTDRVHSWDERNSEKYITFQQIMENVFGRFLDTRNDLFGRETFVPERGDGQIASNSLSASAIAGAVRGIVADSNKIPALPDEENAFQVRYTIYKWYLTHLSLRGMPYDEQGFQLTESHWIQDAHNIYLDYGINFGWPVMALFIVFVWWGIGRLMKQGHQRVNAEKMSYLLLALIPPVFGLFEFVWGTGTIYTVAFYLTFNEMIKENIRYKNCFFESGVVR